MVVQRKRRARVGEKNTPSWVIAVSAVFLVLVTLLVYANTLGHGFVFDDTTLILQSPQVVELRWADIVKGGYRPVRSLTYALNVALGGLDPFGFHLFNVLLHAVNAVLVLFLCRVLMGATVPAFAAGLLYALHPVQTAAVAYISGRKDELAAFFLFSGLLAFLQYRKTHRVSWVFVACALFIGAFLSKEVAIIFPGLLLLVEAAQRARKDTESGPESRVGLCRRVGNAVRAQPFLWSALVVLGGVALYVALVAAPASRMEGLWGGSLASHIGTSFKLFAHYLRLALLPYPLMADYTGAVFPISSGFLELATLGAVLVAALYLAIAFWVFRREALVGLGMLWFVVGLIPVLQLVPFHELAADHFLYLPIFGLVLVAARGWDRLVRERKLDVVGWGLLVLVAGGFALLSFQRNQVWATPKSLWEATYATSEASFRANVNLGFLYYSEGDWERAVRLTERAIELNPESALPHANLGAFFRERGFQEYVKGNLFAAQDLENRAVASLERAVALEPGNPFNISNLGDAFKDLALIFDGHGEQEVASAYRTQAENAFRWALNVGSDNPEFALVEYKLGSVFLDAGDCAKALEYLPGAADRLPHRYQVQLQTGYCYFQEEVFSQSAHYFERALSAWPRSEANNPQFPEVFLGLGESYSRSGEREKAAAAYRRMLQVFPSSDRAHLKLAELSMEAGDLPQAREHLQAASRLSSSPEVSRMIQSLAERLPISN